VDHAACVLTDSGGLQEETTFLKKPCFTLRENTERPLTTEVGSNFLIGREVHRIRPLLDRFDPAKVRIPELWDGNAGRRIVERLAADL
jgi:UDP-N-acetylglucosamine 2-epimerase (non-hydrolysing)